MQRKTGTQVMSNKFEVISVTFLSQQKVKSTKYSDLGLSLEKRIYKFAYYNLSLIA